MSMTHEEVRAAADAIMPPDEEIAEAMRCLRVVRAMENRVKADYLRFAMVRATHDAGILSVVAGGANGVGPTLLAALEAALGIQAEEEAAG